MILEMPMPDKISDNPSTKDIKALLPLARFLGSAAGLAGKLGFKRETMAEFKKTVDELVSNSEILDLPDRFNEAFAGKGWIATNSFSCDVMREALSLHKEGKAEEAEQVILDWFTEDHILLFAINRSSRLHVARLRDDQLREALNLYLEERYIAAVPLILIACDGLASDVSGTSPFEKNADLTCFDSIAGHPTSLPSLIKLVTKGAYKSRDDTMDLPERHKIIHGRSLGYANRLVCTKAWLLYIALVDWAADKESEAKRLEEFEKKERETFRDTLKLARKVQEEKAIINAFQPTEKSGPFADDLSQESGEYSLREFLEGWKARNFGRMAKHAMKRKEQPVNQLAGTMRQMCEFIELEAYQILKIRYSTVARCDAVVHIKAKSVQKEIEGDFGLILFRHTPDSEIAMPDDNANWVVQQMGIYNVLNEKFVEEE